MFITPDIFETETTSPNGDYNSDCFKADFQPSVLGKRRRIESDKALELSPRSKIQLTFKGTERSFRSLPSPPPESRFGYALERTTADLGQRSPASKHRRRLLPLPVKKRRPNTPQEGQQATAFTFTTKPILTPCHICYKAPGLKRQLDAFEDCWRCRERTCYICIRQCQANCGERKICRSCCVEEGEDGDVSCLDCLQCSQDEEMEG